MLSPAMLAIAATAVSRRLPHLDRSLGHIDTQDTAQEAWLAALEILDRHALRPSQARAYLEVSIRRTVLLRQTRARSPVSLSKHAAAAGMCPTAVEAGFDEGWIDLQRASSVSDAPAIPEDQLDTELRAAIVRKAVGRVLMRQPPLVGDVVRRLFGLGCWPLAPAEVAAELKVSRRQVTAALDTFTAAARAVPALCALARE